MGNGSGYWCFCLSEILGCAQCWKFPQVRHSEADNFGGGPAVLEIPPVRGRQLWRRAGNFLLIFLQFYVYDLRFKPLGPTTFLTEFPTLRTRNFLLIFLQFYVMIIDLSFKAWGPATFFDWVSNTGCAPRTQLVNSSADESFMSFNVYLMQDAVIFF